MYWRVVIRLRDDTTVHCRFPNQIAAQVMKKACDEFLNYGMYLDSHVVSCKPRFPDPSLSKPPGKSWCPYCGTWRSYWKRNNVSRCEVCWTSKHDFYWNRINGGSYMKQSGKVHSGSTLTAKERKAQRRMNRKMRKKK